MRWQHFANPSRVITAYHGGPVPIRRFNRKFSAQGVFWFSEDKNKILAGESGASKVVYLMEVRLHVNKTAGWPEYERLSLGELRRDYDSVKLDNDWIIFDPKNIKIISAQKVK